MKDKKEKALKKQLAQFCFDKISTQLNSSYLESKLQFNYSKQMMSVVDNINITLKQLTLEYKGFDKTSKASSNARKMLGVTPDEWATVIDVEKLKKIAKLSKDINDKNNQLNQELLEFRKMQEVLESYVSYIQKELDIDLNSDK